MEFRVYGNMRAAAPYTPDARLLRHPARLRIGQTDAGITPEGQDHAAD